MELEYIKEQHCPICRAIPIAESKHSQHANGEWNESRKFSCGLEIEYRPNLQRFERMRPCAKDPILKEAKDVSLEVWSYFRDHPEVKRKKELPLEIYNKITLLAQECPLCELSNRKIMFYCFRGNGEEEDGRIICLLAVGSSSNCMLYDNWYLSETDEERREAADTIVKRLEAWDV